MLTGMLHLHSVLRWLVIIVAIWSLIQYAKGMSDKKAFTKSDRTPALLFLIFMDLQLVIGLVLYFMGGFGIKAIQAHGFGAIMADSILRFFAVEHTLGMLIALILVHVGYAVTKKDIPDQKKFSKAFYLFLIAFIVIFISIPWPFRDLGRGWMPG